MDQEPVDEIRAPAEVAFRAIALFSVVGLAFGAERSDITTWLAENDLWSQLAPSEADFIDTPAPSRKQIIDASWLSERLITLLWTLGAVNELPPPHEQCDPAVFHANLPPFADITVTEFTSAARLRPSSELLTMAEDLWGLHWEARDAMINDRTPQQALDIEIIQERHHAINWVIGYEDLDWDDVTTDT